MNVVTLEGHEKRFYDLFTLNREYLTQFAALIEVISKYGYTSEECKFEYHLMDICVFRDDKPYIYIETKVSDRGTELLLQKIVQIGPHVGSLLEIPDRGNDALRKSKYIFRDRPTYLWLVTPRKQQAFEIRYTSEGFELTEIADIPRSGAPQKAVSANVSTNA